MLSTTLISRFVYQTWRYYEDKKRNCWFSINLPLSPLLSNKHFTLDEGTTLRYEYSSLLSVLVFFEMETPECVKSLQVFEFQIIDYSNVNSTGPYRNTFIGIKINRARSSAQ